MIFDAIHRMRFFFIKYLRKYDKNDKMHYTGAFKFMTDFQSQLSERSVAKEMQVNVKGSRKRNNSITECKV